MNVLKSYSAINNGILDVAMSINKLTPVQNDIVPVYSRLEESSYVVSQETKRFSSIITAHNLSEYVNRFYDIKLEDNVDNWLDALLGIDKETA